MTNPDATPPSNSPRRFGYAWIALTLALALHVTDEAFTDFLSVYNPAVRAIRQRIPFLPLPTFSFGLWLTGLCGAIFLLLALSPLAFRGSRRLAWIAHPLSVLMFFNGLGHIGSSIAFGRFMPGVISSPVLLLASASLRWEARRHIRATARSRPNAAPTISRID